MLLKVETVKKLFFCLKSVQIFAKMSFTWALFISDPYGCRYNDS